MDAGGGLDNVDGWHKLNDMWKVDHANSWFTKGEESYSALLLMVMFWAVLVFLVVGATNSNLASEAEQLTREVREDVGEIPLSNYGTRSSTDARKRH
mmetsp:Transcript_32306/g.76761  ORF Transcript_32306/g.76761 Transcript_32306/m.76761 type:complete len:97 (+) Transcript_32306:77-367(+)